MASATAPRILIADDDHTLRELMILLLSNDGYAPHAVSSQEAARAAIRRESWDLILLDTLGQGPNERSYAILSDLCREARGTPVVLTTGLDAMARWGRDNNLFAEVALKPFELDWFLNRVSRLVSTANVARVSAHRQRHWNTSVWAS